MSGVETIKIYRNDVFMIIRKVDFNGDSDVTEEDYLKKPKAINTEQLLDTLDKKSFKEIKTIAKELGIKVTQKKQEELISEISELLLNKDKV